MYHSRLAADSSCIQHSTLRIYSAPVGVAEYCDERVYLFVCLSVRPRAYLQNYMSDLHQFL